MVNNTCVYRVVSPSGKAYIGLTSSFKYRYWQHHNSAKRLADLPFARAIRKYGSALVWEIVASKLTREEAEHIEAACIALGNTLVPNGYNAAAGSVKYPKTVKQRQNLATAWDGRRAVKASKRPATAAVLAHLRKHKSKPVVIGAVEYPSAAEAARQLQYSRPSMQKYVDRGSMPDGTLITRKS